MGRFWEALLAGVWFQILNRAFRSWDGNFDKGRHAHSFLQKKKDSKKNEKAWCTPEPGEKKKLNLIRKSPGWSWSSRYISTSCLHFSSVFFFRQLTILFCFNVPFFPFLTLSSLTPSIHPTPLSPNLFDFLPIFCFLHVQSLFSPCSHIPLDVLCWPLWSPPVNPLGFFLLSSQAVVLVATATHSAMEVESITYINYLVPLV